ncbi:MAG: hypothetical protein KIT14_20235 [bacterium]|nr:hypothetical protein [bacterium]
MHRLRRQPLTGLVAVSGVLLGLAVAAPAGAQNLVGGQALGLYANASGFPTIDESPHVVLPTSGGNAQASLISIVAPGLASTGTLTAKTSGTIGLASALSATEGSVEQLNLLGGLIRADALVARSTCTGNGSTATCAATGTTFTNLRINGTLIAANVAPNSFISIPGVATVVVNEQVTTGNGTTTAGLTVNMLHVTLLNGLGEIVVASAHSDVDFRPLADTCLCPTANNTVSGDAFGTEVDVLTVQSTRNPRAVLSARGGTASAQVLSASVSSVLSTGTARASTSGTVTPTNASSQSTAAVEQLSLLGGLITANAVQAQATCTGNGTSATCNAAGTTFVTLSVLGLPIALNTPPNTVIALPLLGSVTINEQTIAGNGTTTRSLRVAVLHVRITNILALLGLGDIVVASAQAGVDFTTSPACPNPCSDGNVCNGIEVCDPVLGCRPGTPLDCSDGSVCNGLETCDPTAGCRPGTPLVCDDGNGCTGLETCDPVGGCQPGSPLACGDDNPCNGSETCDPVLGCRPGQPIVCPTGTTCSPATGACIPIDGCDPALCDDGDLCNGLEACDPQLGCVPGAPPYSAATTFKFKDGGVAKGDVGVNGSHGRLTFGRAVFMPNATAVEGAFVKLGNAASVFDVRATTLKVGKQVSIRGSTDFPDLPLADPYCPVAATPACGGDDVTVLQGMTGGPLPPGTYGRVKIGNGGVLVLQPGTFTFCSLTAGRTVAIRVTGATASSVRVVGPMRLSNNSHFAPDSGTPLPSLTVYGHSLRASAGGSITASISSPQALLTLGRGAMVRGTFCTQAFRTDANTLLECRL